MINPENTQKNAQINPNPKPINHNPQPTMPIHHLTHDTPIGANHTHIGTNPDIADQPRSQQEKKKPISNSIKTQTLPPPLPLDQRFLHRWSTQTNVSSTVMCDVDVGRRMMFLGLKRGESRWEREKKEREDNRNNEGGERNFGRLKILLLFLQYCYSAILKVELHCNGIVKKFAILAFNIPWCSTFWSLKY